MQKQRYVSDCPVTGRHLFTFNNFRPYTIV